jgi:ketosteroid isomerase-like protein
MKKYLTFLFALVFLAGTSCKTEPEPTAITEPNPEADRVTLMKLASEDWDANALAGNMEANVDFYTDDAVRIQDGRILRGKEEIRTVLTDEIRPGFSVSTCENTVDDIRISGNLATVWGEFLGSWANQEYGDTLWTKAAWVGIYERQEDGSWKMVFTMGTELGE